jgi:hypothetical protein
MTADADIPSLPEQYHKAIVWRALVMYAANKAAPEVYAFAVKEYTKIMNRIEFDYLPEIELAGAE